MRARRILTMIIILVVISTLSGNMGQFLPHIHPVAAVSTFTVDLDATSTSQTDTTISTSASPTSAFRVGAVLQPSAPTNGQPLTTSTSFKFIDANTNNVWDSGEAVVNDTSNSGVYETADRVIAGGFQAPGTILSSDPKIKFIDSNGNGIYDYPEIVVYDLNGDGLYNVGERLIGPNVFGWQFAINYDPTYLLPQADPTPSCLTYPDCAGNTALLGSVTSGCPVFGGNVIGGCNWNACQTTCGSAVTGIPTPGKFIVVFTYFLGHGGVFPNAKVLMANVAFELLAKPAAPLSLTISDVKFVDQTANVIPNITDGNGVTETISNDPPHASFTATKISTYVYSFDASASTDSDGTISNPAGYFWDFGDGTQDLGTTGPIILTHDYSSTCTAPCNLTVTLRVVDDGGATGAARDASGAEITDNQPSHASHSILIDLPPTAAFTFTPSTPTTSTTITFDAATSTDPDGIVSSYDWDFGDGSAHATNVMNTHAFSTAGTYHVKLTVTDNAGLTDSKTIDVTVVAPVHLPPTVNVTASTTSVQAGSSTTIQLSATASTGMLTSITVNWGDGTAVQTLSGTATSASHTYATAGTYTVTVMATDDSGASSQKTTSLAVASAPQGGSDLTFLLEIAAIPIVVILAAALLLLRRRGKTSGPKDQLRKIQ